MKKIFLILVVLNTSCKFFDCKNLTDDNIVGKYKVKNSSKSLSLFKNKKYEYIDNDRKFEGEWLISNTNSCEICLKDWITDSSTVIDFMYVSVSEKELIFNYDNPSKNFSKIHQ